jgi:hypothetical protein
MIEVPPAPGGNVILERDPAVTFRTSEGSVAPMGEPNIDLVFVGVERDALDPPRLFQGQEF